MILVTGGAGFIGSNFIEDWLASTDEPVITIDALTYAGLMENMAGFLDSQRHIFVKADITDRTAIETVLSTYSPRAVVHFAAESHVDRSIGGPDAFLHSNVIGTYALLETTRNYYERLLHKEQDEFRLLHISTDEVFGALNMNSQGFSEQSPYRPNNPYSASKSAADHFARAWHMTFGLPVIISHSCNNFGPHQHTEKLIPRIITSALQGAPLPIYGDGLHRRDWIYVKDNCAALKTILAQGQIGESYVIGGTREIANIDLVKLICAHLDVMIPRKNSYVEQIHFVPDRLGHDRRYRLDDSKIRRELSWKPETNFDEALQKTITWYISRQNPIKLPNYG